MCSYKEIKFSSITVSFLELTHFILELSAFLILCPPETPGDNDNDLELEQEFACLDRREIASQKRRGRVKNIA